MPDRQNGRSSAGLRLISRSRRGGLNRVRKVPFMAAVAADEIVREQLQAGNVALEALRTAWRHKEITSDPRDLWRILADVQGTNADAPFEAAALRSGFSKADVSIERTEKLIARTDFLNRPHERARLLELAMFPAMPAKERSATLRNGVIVAIEPQHRDVRSFAASHGYDSRLLRFASPGQLAQLTRSCFEDAPLENLWWNSRFVRNERPIRLFFSTEFQEVRRAA
ncbi:MAG: hypothetical protein KJO98_01795 [Rhodothermia bacterium]|nr:hypothetical protein [Rhodothermia bacterium]